MWWDWGTIYISTCTQLQLTTLSHSHIYIYIQQFSVPRLQDTNLLIPSSDWSIKYLLELLWTFPFQLFFRVSFAALVRFFCEIRGGKIAFSKHEMYIYHTTTTYNVNFQHLLGETFRMICSGWHYFDLNILYVTENVRGT